MSRSSVSFASSLIVWSATARVGRSRKPTFPRFKPKIAHRLRQQYTIVASLVTIQPNPKEPKQSKSQGTKVKVLLPKFWTAAIIELLTGLLGIAVCTLCRLPILGSKFSLTIPNIGKSLKVAIPFSLAFWMIEIFPSGLKEATDRRFKAFFEPRTFLDVAIFCVCVSFGEELLFRSCLLGGLCALGLQPLLALTVSSVIFGALHAYTMLYVILASVAGFLFGAMFLYTSSILQPVIVHFVYDFITIMIMKIRWRRSQTSK